ICGKSYYPPKRYREDISARKSCDASSMNTSRESATVATDCGRSSCSSSGTGNFLNFFRRALMRTNKLSPDKLGGPDDFNPDIAQTEHRRFRGAYCWLMFGAAFALRFGYGLWHHQPLAPGGDSEFYLRMAQGFLNAHAPLLITHPPVYPFFLAITFLIPGRMLGYALFAQSLVGAGCVLLAYQLGTFLYGERMAKIALIWVAFDPFLIYFSAYFLSETLFTALLLAGFLLLGRGQRFQRLGLVAGSGFFFSLAA